MGLTAFFNQILNLMLPSFDKKFFGKWVLSGEYSVLRAGPALVYPFFEGFIRFKYKDSGQKLLIRRAGGHRPGLDFSLSPALDKALKITGRKREDLTGALEVTSELPFGAGLGASAALCSGIAHLFLQKSWITAEKLKSFAVSLEDIFHGKSSGMDITAILEQKPLLYKRREPVEALSPFKTQPRLFLSYSGGRAATATGVLKVRKLFDADWSKAEQLDRDMIRSVELCLQASRATDLKSCTALLSEGLDLGSRCFYKWGLISYDLESHIAWLKKKGALAVKPTGSGLGGHVISLWRNALSLSDTQNLIPLKL